MFCSVRLPVVGPSCGCTASADACCCLSPSLECVKLILLADVPTAITGTEVDNSLFRMSRTCLELTAIGNPIGASVRQKEGLNFSC